MNTVRPKKHLGQHFLKDKALALRIVDLLACPKNHPVIEIGPGRGVLTQFLLERYPNLWLIEVDPEAVRYIEKQFEAHSPRIYQEDILKWDMTEEIPLNSYFIGNLPYNISSPIFFRVLEHMEFIQKGVFMIQKEVADRICSPPGNKTFGILSVLLGAYYDLSYAITVSPQVFIPPPKVKSAVIVLNRKTELPNVSFSQLKRVVKQAFNQRRKTLKNALKGLEFEDFPKKEEIMCMRAEQLRVDQFVFLAQRLIS